MFIRNLVSVLSSCLNMIHLLLLSMFVCGVFGAEYTLPGSCPNLKVQENLNFTRFSGLWYLAAGYASDGRNISDCATFDFQEDNMGYIMRESYIDDENDRKTKKSYTARVDLTFDAGTSALFIVSYEAGGQHQDNDKVLQFPFFILATDYENFAVTYYCKWRKGSEKKHYVFTWILTRSNKKLDGSVLTKVEDAVSHYSELASKWNSFVFKDNSSPTCHDSNIQESTAFTKNYW